MKKMKQMMLTPAAGKRLIGKGLASHAALAEALKNATVVITGGTTNGYVAEEILAKLNIKEKFPRRHFFRGVNLPPGYTMPKIEDRYLGDVVLVKGQWLKGKTITEVAESLKEGDYILKGANALDLGKRQAAILVGNPTGGTGMLTFQASIGRRVGVIIPVGLEKRVPGDLSVLAAKINLPGAPGLRFMPVPGQVFTELEAISLLSGASAELIGSGGVCGAEGSVWLEISGSPEQEEQAEKLLKAVSAEAAFMI
jgi:hypothetical protein